ncbi:MAG: fumarylacetoacetate hydrolase family protein [Burkholderiales bacterium]|nr:fumarylacetoacetate hydrolase family protein [Burkholderiales bacterium]
MRLVTFVRRRGARPLAGALVDGDALIVDLQAAHRARHRRSAPQLASVLAIAEGGAPALDLARELVADAARAPAALVPAKRVRLLAPIPDPPQMRDFLCFEKHLVQAFQAARKLRARSAPDPEQALRDMEARGILAVPQTWYERPIFYHPSRFAVCGPEAEVPWPSYSKVLDFELEFGCYIGRPGKDIAREAARGHVFGYTIFNDFSARDEQTLEMPGQLGPGKGKDFDNANAMGPCLVTADEIHDPYALAMAVRVNGEEWGRGTSADMRWKFEDCIAHVSRSETLRTGEFFGSGTVGDGCGLEHMRFLAPGDVVELEVERIGVLRNRVVRR